MNDGTRARWVVRWAMILIGANLLWRGLRYALNFPMWGDEGFVAVSFFTRSWLDYLDPLDHIQIAPLGFLWMTHAVRSVLGIGEPALRLVPFLAGIASPFVFAALAFRVLDRRSALLALGIFAAAYYTVRHAAEVKPYSLDLLTALLILHAAWSVHLRPRAAGPWIAFIAATSLGVWMSYPSVFVSGAALLAIAWSVRGRMSKGSMGGLFTASMLLLVNFGVMWTLVGSGQAAEGKDLFETGQWVELLRPPIGEPWKLPWWLLDVHTGNMFAYPMGGKNFGSVATTMLCICGLVALWNRRAGVLLLLLTGPFLVNLFAAFIGKYPYGGSARTTQHLAPLICLLAGLGLNVAMVKGLGARRALDGLRVALIVFLVIIAGGITQDLLSPYKHLSDQLCRATVRDLADRSGPDDQWIVWGDYAGTSHAPALVQWAGAAARFRYDVVRYAPVSVTWAPVPDETFPWAPDGGATRLLVYRHTSRPFPQALFDTYLAALVAQRGQPIVLETSLQEGDEAITTYTWE